jgi:oligopeptidase B
MGWDWYEAGKLKNKKQSMEDLIVCAEHLISEGYTTPEKLALYGKSAGGTVVIA